MPNAVDLIPLGTASDDSHCLVFSVRSSVELARHLVGREDSGAKAPQLEAGERASRGLRQAMPAPTARQARGIEKRG